MVQLIPFLVLFEHRIQDGQQFAHAGNQGHFFGLTCGNQTRIKRLYHRVKTGCHKRSHVQCGSHASPSAKYGSSPSHCTRVPVYQGDANKRTDLTSGETPQLGNLCQQRRSSQPTPLTLLNRSESSLKWFWMWLFISLSIRASSSSSALMMILRLFLLCG